MYKIPLAEIKEKIISSEKINAEKLDLKIKDKINELSGLISEEGAAHIIANELGVELVAQNGSKLKIKEIYAGMRNISTLGKVIQKFDVREFNTGERSGKVCALVLGDETDSIRVVFWNEQVDLLDKVNADDILMIKDAFVKDNRGNKEIHLGQQGSIIVNPEGEKVETVRRAMPSFDRKKIADLQGGEENTEIMGTIVQVFDPRFFYVCPDCGKKANEEEGSYKCVEHGVVTPKLSYVMNAVLDDGSGNIRGVFWRNQVAHLLSKTEEEISAYKDNLGSFEDMKTELLGEQFKLMGRVNKNDMFNRLEFSVQLVNKADPKEELARLE